MAAVNYVWLQGQLAALTAQPVGTYGISYDIYTRPTEDSVPTGWQSSRSNTYRELIKLLRASQFHRHQYSDYRRPDTTASHAYFVMISLGTIPPLSKVPTTLKGLKMHYISDMNLMDVTNEVKLGGNLSRCLCGPAPHDLVRRLVGWGQNLSQVPQPVIHGDPGVPPRYTSPTVAARNVQNYLG